MAEISLLIRRKLIRYSPDIQKLALESLKLSLENPEGIVFERLKGFVREIVQTQGVVDDS